MYILNWNTGTIQHGTENCKQISATFETALDEAKRIQEETGSGVRISKCVGLVHGGTGEYYPED